jgi:hypothetical protein
MNLLPKPTWSLKTALIWDALLVVVALALAWAQVVPPRIMSPSAMVVGFIAGTFGMDVAHWARGDWR